MTSSGFGGKWRKSPKLRLNRLMRTTDFTRRAFIRHGLALAAGAPLASLCARTQLLAAEAAAGAGQAGLRAHRAAAKVAIASCRSYGPEVRPALGKCFDLLGGIGSLVKDKTVTVKLNLTGSDFKPLLGRPVGETVHDTLHHGDGAGLAAVRRGRPARALCRIHAEERRAGVHAGGGGLGCAGADARWARWSSRTRATWASARDTPISECPGAGICFPRLSSTMLTRRPTCWFRWPSSRTMRRPA